MVGWVAVGPCVVAGGGVGVGVTVGVGRAEGATRVGGGGGMPRREEGVLVGFQGIVRDQGPLEEAPTDPAP